MQAGQLRHRITISKPVITQNAAGEAVVNKTEPVNLWADFTLSRGRDIDAGDVIRNQETGFFEIRYREGLKPDYIVTHEGIDWEIISIQDREKRKKRMIIDVVRNY